LPQPFSDAAEFGRELTMLRDALAEATNTSGGSPRSARRVSRLISAMHVFGFHLASLDVRNNSDQHEATLSEILGGDYQQLSVPERNRLLRELLGRDELKNGRKPSPVVEMFHAIAEGQREGSQLAVRNYIISMARDTSDVWEVLALAGMAGLAALDKNGLRSSVHPVPLFETIGDLDAAPRVLDELFEDAAYRGYLRSIGDTQQVMVGYSDSNKDGGYITSHWLLYQGQQRMAEVARRHGIRIIFFHGRGGTVARGGGRTYEAILALPANTVCAKLRITEQGEVINSKYADEPIAQRNLELTISGTVLASVPSDGTAAGRGLHLVDGDASANSAMPVAPPRKRRGRPAPTNGNPALGSWTAAVEALSQASFELYKRFVHGSTELLEYFWETTPIRELSALNIGSRPAFRREDPSVQTERGAEEVFGGMRAIPWVFAWTQCRALMPAWFGLGTALAISLERRGGKGLLRQMYHQWSFFRDLIDNAEMALAKADMRIARVYASLDPDRRRAERVFDRLQSEFERAVHGVLQITGEAQLLQRSSVLRRSIRLRNPYVDPLSYLQVRLLAEKRRGELEADGDRALLLTMHGIAAGMRNTG
jgi:phosphoenolpyruvate carboxylase